MSYKTRKFGDSETLGSSSVPPGMQPWRAYSVKVPKKMKSGGYECPYSKKVKVQNSTANVLQYVLNIKTCVILQLRKCTKLRFNMTKMLRMMARFSSQCTVRIQ